jgi:membrane protease YdiL (CAAX protease family)
LSIWIPYQHESIENWPDSWPGVVSQWWVTVIATGFFEEFIFRGLLMAWLVNLYPPDFFQKRTKLRQILVGSPDRLSRLANQPSPSGFIESASSDFPDAASSHAIVFAVIVSAGLFGLAHWSQGAAPVSLFLLGLFLGWLFLKTRSLWACIFTHMLFNAYSLFWATLAHM